MSNNKLPVGSVRIRTRHKRGGERRAWVKVAEPNEWKLRAQVVWESHNGPLPRGMVVHHKDEDKLNDTVCNLEAMTKAKHLAKHRHEFAAKAMASFAITRRKRRWSTKSDTKKTGRPCAWPDSVMLAAVANYKSGGGSLRTVAAKYGVTFSALEKRAKRV